MALSFKDLSSLLTILHEDGKPLKDLTVTFCRIFPKTDHFRAGCAVSVLLTDRLLTLSQRIVAWYILHTVFAPGPDGTPPHNPFLLVFLDAMEAATAAPTPEYAAEVALLVQLLSARDADVSALTAEAVLRAPPRAAPAQLPDFTALRKAYHAASPVPRLAALEVRPVVLAPTPSLWGFKPPSLVQAAAPSVPFAPGTFPAPRVPSTTASAAPQRSTGAGSGAGAGAAATTGTSASGKSDNGSGSGADAAAPTATAATATSAADADRIRMLKATAARMLPPALLSLRGVKPEFARPPPPLLDVKESELMWITPLMGVPLLWDATMCVPSPANGTALRDLMEQAGQGPLTQPRTEEILSALKHDPKLVYHCGLTPAKLPALVEHNSMVAVECLVILKETSSNQLSEYLTALASAQLTLSSMEVMNRLTSTVGLPPEFVHLYISNCISTCQTITDRYLQNRLVRLVCVFLQSLIRNRLVKVNVLFVEVQAFCIEFSRIKEAASLFRLLRSLEKDKALAPGG